MVYIPSHPSKGSLTDTSQPYIHLILRRLRTTLANILVASRSARKRLNRATRSSSSLSLTSLTTNGSPTTSHSYHSASLPPAARLSLLLILPFLILCFGLRILLPSTPIPLSPTTLTSIRSDFDTIHQQLPVAPRTKLKHVIIGQPPVIPNQHPSIKAIAFCSGVDCCPSPFGEIDNLQRHLPKGIVSLMTQSLIPNSLTLVHSCQKRSAALLERTVQSFVKQTIGFSTYNNDLKTNFLSVVRCDPSMQSPTTGTFDDCLLAHLASPQKFETDHVFVMDAGSHILEPLAIEKLWLYHFMRGQDVQAVRTLSYDKESLLDVLKTGDPLRANISYPTFRSNTDDDDDSFDEIGHSVNEKLRIMSRRRRKRTQEEDDEIGILPTLPILYSYGLFKVHNTNMRPDDKSFWNAWIEVMKKCRILREPLYTDISTDEKLPRHVAGIDIIPHHSKKKVPILAFHPNILTKDDLPPFLWSEYAFYKWSARQEYDESYRNKLESQDEKNTFDIWPMPFRNIRKPGQKDYDYAMKTLSSMLTRSNLYIDQQDEIKMVSRSKPHVFFVMPWIQMGGSEKCVLDIAERMIQLQWPVTFVLTMPFWHEDAVGEIGLQHEWIDKALSLTSDVFDIVHLAPNEKFSKLLRYLLESRKPDYIFTGNSRVIYEHAEFIKAVVPSVTIADYNHMVHMDWEVEPGKGGGMPRYGTSYTKWIDLHLTASNNVTTSMKKWIQPNVLADNPEKVKTCYIGTEPSALHSDDAKIAIRAEMRSALDLSDDKIVILFAGRFVKDKGIDVMAEVLTNVAEDSELSSKLAFVFVGAGDQHDILETVQSDLQDKDLRIIIQPPAVGLAELRNYYAMADIFLLPSSNEGVALVLYEAMAAGMLVMATDVGGQKELIRSKTGILLPNLHSVEGSASFILRQLQAVIKFRPMFREIQESGTLEVRQRFTTARFCDCVIENMMRAKKESENDLPPGKRDKVLPPDQKLIESLRPSVRNIMRGERVHGMWNRDRASYSIESVVTVGIKTYVCDPSIVRQVVGLVRSIRVNYPNVRILLANDGPTILSNEPMIRRDPYTEEIRLPPDSGISIGRNHMVNMTTTKYFVLLDDDHVFDEDTDLHIAAKGMEKGDGFDVVGIRVRNLPGIEELEKISIFIPRYVAKVTKFENRKVTLCVWNENNGPGVQNMRTPIRVDVLHNALIARTDVLRAHPWRNELKVNEHMTFFLDARKAGIKVGYLPSVFVHHRARHYSECYKSVRFREDKYEEMLEYDDSYLWDAPCGDNFPERVAKHIEETIDQ